MVLTLCIITTLAATALGYVYEFTTDPIKMASVKKTNTALKLVLPEFTGNPGDEKFTIKSPVEGLDDMDCYPARNENGELVGFAIKTSTKIGFSGLFRVMVGYKPDGTVFDTFVLEHKETPGLGTGMKEDRFKKQFKGKNPGSKKTKVKKDGGEINAITAATITSRAFCDALNNASEAFKTIDLEKYKQKQ